MASAATGTGLGSYDITYVTGTLTAAASPLAPLECRGLRGASSGSAVFDYDNDGRLDILQVFHGRPGHFEESAPIMAQFAVESLAARSHAGA